MVCLVIVQSLSLKKAVYAARQKAPATRATLNYGRRAGFQEGVVLGKMTNMLTRYKRRLTLGVTSLVVLFLGCALTVEMPETLIATTSLATWAWQLTFAISGVLLLCFWCIPSWHSGLSAAMEDKMPTHLFRVLLGFPLMSLFIAGVLIAAPLGYVYGFAYITGSFQTRVSAVVLEAEPTRSSGKSCKQRFKFHLDSAVSKVCVEGRVVGPLPVTGQRVELRGIQSVLGFWVQEVHTTAVSAPS